MPFSGQHAVAACNFFELALKHSADSWYGQPFVLSPWQEALCQILGQLDEAGNRVIEMVYVETPKKPLHVDTPIPSPGGWKNMGEVPCWPTFHAYRFLPVLAPFTPVLATLQQIVQSLATTTTSIANVVNHAQGRELAD